MAGYRSDRRLPRPLVRRVDGRDIRIHRGDGFRWLDLAEGYRVRLERAGGNWVARREGADDRIARARTLGAIVGAVVRHYRALS
ncbi:hypothetical protein [Falsiroseomonas oryzae]|uniref:hypothetical protein n=1 Tax=Falsiroseomonas oryzae TaxID=2766473 RepID=UPI0022EAED51|nr:hypothetical protein [Roseomonas sp. MO-31]